MHYISSNASSHKGKNEKMIPSKKEWSNSSFFCATLMRNCLSTVLRTELPEGSIENSTPQREDQEEPTHRLQTKARFHFILGFLLHKKQRVQAEGSTQRERGWASCYVWWPTSLLYSTLVTTWIALHLLFYPLEEKKNCNEVAERRTAWKQFLRKQKDLAMVVSEFHPTTNRNEKRDKETSWADATAASSHGNIRNLHCTLRWT